jgi:hypothetical protein
MRNATLQDLTGWSDEECVLVDERLDILGRWRAANGRTGRTVEAVFPSVDAWARGRGAFEIWMKCTRSLHSSEIAEFVRTRHPEMAQAQGCGDVLDALQRGLVLDLDGFYVEELETVDFSRPVAEIIEDVKEVIRREGAVYVAEDAPRP